MKFIAIAAIVGAVGAGGMYVGGDKVQCLVGRITGSGCPSGGCAHGGCHHGDAGGACGTASNAIASAGIDVAAVVPATATATATATAAAGATAVPGQVNPWEPVEEGFRGCDKSCGSRADGAEAGVSVQHGDAKVGERVFCPVSGVVITVGDGSAHRDVGGHRYYFCCESCAAYFSANVAKVMQARGMLTAS